MLKINSVFREVNQADILKAYCILFGGQSGPVTSYSCSETVSQRGETQRMTHLYASKLHRGHLCSLCHLS